MVCYIQDLGWLRYVANEMCGFDKNWLNIIGVVISENVQIER